MADIRQQLLDSKVGEIIKVADDLASVASGLELQFPQVIVVGQESAGKSSVLERIAMLQFFPRGQQITTRMPIKLQMTRKTAKEMEDFCKLNSIENNSMAWIKLNYVHASGEVTQSNEFLRVDEVEAKVDFFMKKAVETQNQSVTGIIHDELIIEIVSEAVPNLSLVDLPGIFGARYENEPEDVKTKTKKLVEKYLQMPHTLVLAILPANERIRNSPAMHLIQKFGKEKQTIGVLTKSDLSYHKEKEDPYSPLKEKLDGKSADYIQLPRGYIAVKNRDDSLSNVDLSTSSSEEIKWFKQNLPGYYESGKVGSDNLVAAIGSALQDYVSEVWIDAALNSISKVGDSTRLELDALGDRPSPSMIPSILQFIQTNFFDHFHIDFDEDVEFHKNFPWHEYNLPKIPSLYSVDPSGAQFSFDKPSSSPNTFTTTVANPFGTNSPIPQTTSKFSFATPSTSTTASSSPFGSSGVSLFGSTPARSSLFGNSTPSTSSSSLFGGSSPLLTSTGNSLFGASSSPRNPSDSPATGFSFGSSSAPSAQVEKIGKNFFLAGLKRKAILEDLKKHLDQSVERVYSHIEETIKSIFQDSSVPCVLSRFSSFSIYFLQFLNEKFPKEQYKALIEGKVLEYLSFLSAAQQVDRYLAWCIHLQVLMDNLVTNVTYYLSGDDSLKKEFTAFMTSNKISWPVLLKEDDPQKRTKLEDRLTGIARAREKILELEVASR